ncbi:type IV secretory system conjugative DNA transfer family protein [Fimbriiglobus ruber]|uniref:TraD/TraG TraM recognition site domain-containing protein n=1 Tax=Fimbriiglobus ruber TaxID=1908690 RepID=A0A225DCA4_9BACT|nr:TraM recognition domain-containing protein [Fimbriiglobus ruber]OWK34926.1 hypothetical protein FRUB_09768 [Fimbriiglobus ruber]
MRSAICVLLGVMAEGIALALYAHDRGGDRAFAGLFGLCGVGFLALALRRTNRQNRTTGAGLLDKVLLRWGADTFTLRDLLSGGVAVFGASGSGKTSSTGRALAKAILRHRKGGGLILAAKPEDRAMWEGWFRAAGRSRDLLILDGKTPLRLNFIDCARRLGWDARETAKMLMIMGESLNARDARREDSGFWEKQQFRMIYYACLIINLAYDKLSATDIHRFITASAKSAAELRTPEFAQGFHATTIQHAQARARTDRDKHDLSQAITYYLNELVNLSDRTRSSIETGVFGLLDTYCTGKVHDLIGTTTNITPDVMLDGKFILVDLPPSETGEFGLIVGGGLKYLTQRMVLKREVGEGDGFHVTWCDEAQLFITSFDHEYLAQSRSHYGCMVYLTQSLHSYYGALPGESGKSQTQAILSNFKVKVAHALGDSDSAAYFSSLVGKERQTFPGGSLGQSRGSYDEMFGASRFTGSFSEQVTDILQPNNLMSNMRTGGPDHCFLCDVFLFRSGVPFSTGRNFLRVAFSQKD